MKKERITCRITYTFNTKIQRKVFNSSRTSETIIYFWVARSRDKFRMTCKKDFRKISSSTTIVLAVSAARATISSATAAEGSVSAAGSATISEPSSRRRSAVRVAAISRRGRLRNRFRLLEEVKDRVLLDVVGEHQEPERRKNGNENKLSLNFLSSALKYSEI